MSSPIQRSALIVSALAMTFAACSGGSETAETTTTTVASTTTTSTEATTTTSEAPVDTGLVAPLTGVAVEEALTHPALMIKIDNHPAARPQSGLDDADIVVEMLTEGLTRFGAVFHTNQPSHVGPVRSSRTSDFDLAAGFNRPLYGSSGGNDYVLAELRRQDLIAVTSITQNVYYRDNSRERPHNLYVNTADLFALAPADAEPPDPWFLYRADDEAMPAAAEPVTGAVTINYSGSPRVTFTWDEDRGGWARTQDGRDHLDDAGEVIAPPNVVIMVTTYGTSPADPSSAELNSVGEGDLFVLTNGHLIEGTWSRAARDQAPVLLNAADQPIRLTPGQTWVLYPEAGDVVLP